MYEENADGAWRHVNSSSRDPTIRPRAPSDDARMVAIYNSIEWDFPPLSAAEYRRHGEAGATSGYFEQVVAQQDRVVCGYGVLSASTWAQQRDDYLASIRVQAASRRQGLGYRLYDVLLDSARRRGAKRLHGWIREDLPAARQFVKRRGFQPTGRLHRFSRLNTSAAKMDGTVELERGLYREGITILTLAELEGENGSSLRGLYTGIDPDKLLREMTGPGRSLASTWVAFDGDQVAAITWLRRRGRGAAFHEQVGVLKGNRGRDAARALTARVGTWAHCHGIEWLYMTSSGKLPSGSDIYSQLGYTPLAARLEVAKEVEA